MGLICSLFWLTNVWFPGAFMTQLAIVTSAHKIVGVLVAPPFASAASYLGRSPHPIFWLLCSPPSSYTPGTFPLPCFVYTAAPDRKLGCYTPSSSWKPLLTQAEPFTEGCLCLAWCAHRAPATLCSRCLGS